MQLKFTRRVGRQMPRPLRTAGVLALYGLQVLQNVRGTHPRECPCCAFEGRFAMYGHPPRYDSRCPQCGSNERQRLIVLALERRRLTTLADKALYFTPEPVLYDYLRSRVASLEIVDLKTPDRIDAADETFDLILASNVLEHAPDDEKALAELRRVLRPGGRLVITVPLVGGWDETYENPPVESEQARLLHFGERNHMRYYGRDVRERIERAGFSVEPSVAGGEESVRYALIRGDYVFVAQKAAAGAAASGELRAASATAA